MNPELICLHCMGQLDHPDEVCPHCGADPKETFNAPNQLECGSILAGTYLVGCVLGQGGFGITYIGLDLNLNLKVAIKEYYPEGYVTREGQTRATVIPLPGERKALFEHGKERFVSEAKTLAIFGDDPAIVGVRAFFFENGTAYIVMNFVEGETLKEYVKLRGGKLPAREVFAMMEPLFASLSKVHEAGLLHRDISPDNIMRRKNGSLILLDFGAARQMSIDGEHSNTINVKHGFAPEEQYRTHGEQGPWTDVYALCATIYRLTTGVTPQQALDRAMSDAPLLPPSQLGAALSAKQEQALLHGLAIRADQRTRSIEQLKVELKSGNESYAARNDSEKRPSPSIEEKPASKKQTKQQRPKRFLGWVALMAVTMTAAVILLVFLRDQPKNGMDAASTTNEPINIFQTPSQTFASADVTTAPAEMNGTQTTGQPSKISVGMITFDTDSSNALSSDPAWIGCSAWASDQALEAAYYQPTEDSDDARIRAIETAIANGANVIVCSNFMFGNVLQQVPQQYPDTLFLGIDLGLGDVSSPLSNTALITFHEEQAGFLAGYAAVKDGYSDLAFIGGIPIPAVVRYGYGFLQGANQAATEMGNTNDVSIKYWYSDSFQANDEIYYKAKGWYQEGTQIIFSVGGGIVNSIVTAAEETNGKVIGCDTDQSGLSACVVTSAMKDVKSTVSRILADLQVSNGVWSAAYAAKASNRGVAEGGVCLPTDAGSWRFQTFTTDAYQTLYEKLSSGELSVSATVDRHPNITIQVIYLNE